MDARNFRKLVVVLVSVGLLQLLVFPGTGQLRAMTDSPLPVPPDARAAALAKLKPVNPHEVVALLQLGGLVAQMHQDRYITLAYDYSVTDPVWAIQPVWADSRLAPKDGRMDLSTGVLGNRA